MTSSSIRPNRLRQIWQDGGAAANGWITLPSTLIAETLAHLNFDSITLDMQHGHIDYRDAWGMLTAISTTDTVPIVRVPWNEPGILMRVLDAGAYGVICPMINTREQAEAFVAACRYPPLGERSYGPIRAKLYGGADYYETANQTVMTFAMIETPEAIKNIAEITSVPGLDGIYIGPGDLSASMGQRPKFDHGPGPVRDAINTALKAAVDNGTIAGIHNATAEYAREMIGAGFQIVSVSSDLKFMSDGIENSLAILKAR